MLHFYDMEVYSNLWTAVIIDPQRRQETVIVNDREHLQDYYNKFKNEIFVGFNNRSYDQWIFKGILAGFDPKPINDWIILQDRKGWEYSDTFRKIPINNYDVMTGYYGLKTLEAFMGNDIRETTIPFDYAGTFTPAMIDEVIKYNRHDVLQTMEVFKYRINEFNSQVALLNTFNLPFSYIGKTQAQLAAEILGAIPVKTNDEWDIRLPHTLKLDKYQYIADWFLAKRETQDLTMLETYVAGVPHVFGDGGGHAALLKYHYTCGPDEIMFMADVDQLYPSLMVYYDLLSRAIHEPERFKVILNKSLELKRLKKKKEREPFKRICNIVYGAMGDLFNKLYDPLHRRLVCIFGQLLILDLIEKIEDFVELIQNNTDGILIKLKRSDVDRLKEEVKKWEERTMLHMSFDEYETIHQGDVNNYLAIDYNGEIKSKGAYVKPLNPLDYDLPIVNKAITKYLVDGISPKETIYACDDLIEFQKVVKVSSKYLYGTLNGERLSDKTFRVFASTRSEDGIIGKVKVEGGTIEKFANTPNRAFIWNQSVRNVKIPDYLDRDYYVDLAVTRIKDKFNIIIPA